MELREWAESILYSADLAVKLSRPGVISDAQPGPAVTVPGGPARPHGLAWGAGHAAARVAFPTIHQLERDDQRGVVLHFFANHELLALELMALALLRFPEAPAAFRRGIAGIMQEEQSHLSRYLVRMKELGVAFGAVPVNGYFWDVMAPTPSPLVFVMQMSMTFEQANLDFARHYLDAFTLIGDQPTAQLMDTVYREEIDHVGHGVLWFNRWREGQESDWQAYKRLLPLPLTPARAKGPGLQVEARYVAGLSEEFVRELGLYRHSKGRPPRLFWFNPTVEEEIAQGGHYSTPKALQVWACDLGSLLQFLANEDDVVLTESRPSPEFLMMLDRIGYKIPQFVTPNERIELRDRLFEKWSPWGQSATSLTLANALGVRWQQSLFSPPTEVFSKAWAKEIAPSVVDDPFPGRVCRNLGQVKDAVTKWLVDSAVVIKAPLGCAGRNMLRVQPETGMTEHQQRWLERILRQQGAVVVEPWCRRIADYSVQLDVTSQGTTVLGVTRFLTDQRGQYIGHVLGFKHAGLAPDVVRAYHEIGVSTKLKEMAVKVGDALAAAGYVGPAGIDAFLYESNSGFRLQPLVEINPRYTMGRIALALDQKIYSRAEAVWRHWPLQQVLDLGYSDFASFVTSMSERYPLIQRHGWVEQGIIPTNDPQKAKAVLTLLMVGGRSQENVSKVAVY